MAARSVAKHRVDARNTLKGKSRQWLRRYIGTHSIRIVECDRALTERFGESLVSPSLRKAIAFLHPLAAEDIVEIELPEDDQE